VVSVAFFYLSTPALAQETKAHSRPGQQGHAAKVKELQKIIETQQQQLDTQQGQLELQQKQLEEQKKMLKGLQQEMRGLAENEKALKDQEVAQRETEPSQMQAAAKQTPSSAQKDKLESEVSVFEELFRDSRNRPKGMKLPDGWIPLPGRNTDVRFGGFVQANFIHDFQNAGYPYGEFITSQIEAPTDDTANTEFDPRTSRLTFETRTPGPKDAYYNTFFSIDFAGNTEGSSIQPRLRQAYLSGVGIFSGAAFAVGQTWTTFIDLGVWPDIFDLEGPNAMTGTRQVLARYSFILDEAKHFITDFSLEQPETGVQNGNGLSSLPDAVVRMNWRPGWGHLTAAALGRQLVAESMSGTGKDSAFAWGLSLSGELKVPNSKDNFRFQVQGGSGIGRYVFDLGSAPTPQDAFYNEATATLSPLEEFGVFGAYQHHWADKWRSTLVLGYLSMNNLAEQPPDELKQTIYAVGNLVYRLYDRLDVGLEYYWGQRKNKDGQTGSASRLMLSVKYPF
jgi:hypothetical protein